MTKREVLVKAIAGQLTWLQAADILGITARHMRRLKRRYEEHGIGVLRDGRAGRPRRKRIPPATIAELCRLKREVYADYSVKHFHEAATEKHKLVLSYTWTKHVLQAAGLAEKAPARGKYRRKRERRPLPGLLVHMDASTHRWLPDVAMWDLMVALDDADGRIVYARFWPQEGTRSTMHALHHVLTTQGRFCELYTDRGSHFCRTTTAGAGPDSEHEGQVSRALRVLGIRQILARSPEARGRSERAFGTIQGRLPQELRVAGIRTYEQANKYLDDVFVADFNRRFTVQPAQRGSAYSKLRGLNLELLLTAQHDRVVRKDHTLTFDGIVLQLEPSRYRRDLSRCAVTVHEMLDGTLAVAFQGRLLASYDRTGELLRPAPARRLA